jgi:Ca-activated chloride channel family protein
MKTSTFGHIFLLLLIFTANGCYHAGVANRQTDGDLPPPPVIQEVPDEEPEFMDESMNGDLALETTPAPPPPPPPPPPLEHDQKALQRTDPAKPTEPENWNTEDYDHLPENEFQSVLNRPLSTFSVDVDRASYANVRRFLRDNQWPAAGSVRIEEMINYFDYQYQPPQDGSPFSVHTEMVQCPWNTNNQLLRIGLKGMEIPGSQIPAGNLVFLLDVSGSMDAPNKLPLLKRAFGLLTQQLRPEDRVAIVVYAGASGLVLPATPGDQQMTILEALERLEAGGSTAGAAGIKLAYETARKNFIPKGNNRVILATDGDFNIGASSDAALVEMIEKERADGIFLSILGFGDGNYKDNKMEQLADHGNGNYAYIDNLLEAKKVLVNEFSSTLFTIARDVKLQIEFNPAQVQSYRLIGYENRLLRDEDFNDDTKDAGEIGAGHSVTALYELVPAGATQATTGIDPLEFQSTQLSEAAKNNPNWLSLKLRYKKPEEEQSQLLRFYAQPSGKSFAEASEDTRFAAAVAGFGMLLRRSKYAGDLSLEDVIEMARTAKGEDREGYRAEMIGLVELARALQ